jgi:TetR/AcrR family transcriptional regulator
MTEARLSRRERQKLNNREEILEAALAVFTERGFHAASMKEIAERAEFATGTLYSFFESKEELYKALLLDRCRTIGRIFSAALNEGDDEYDTLLRFIHTKARVYRDYRHILELYSFGLRGGDLVLSRVTHDADVKGLYDKLLRRLAELFRRGAEKGLFKAIDPDDLALSFEAITNTFVALWIEKPEAYSAEEKEATIARIFFEGVKA